MEKKLCKSTKNGKLFGVCAGIAEYFNVDVTVIRLITVLLVLFAGLSIWVYIIAALILPDDKKQVKNYDDYKEYQ